MENILYNIGQVLGITIIHSLWQGLFIYFMLKLALFIGGKMSADKKYMLALTSLIAITCWFFYTLITEIQSYSWLAQLPDKLSAMPLFMELPKGVRTMNNPGLRYYYSIEKYLPFITALYITGLLFNVTRILMASRKIKQIKQTMSIDIQLQRQVNKFTAMLNIDHRVKIGISKLVDVPCMVGYFKPIILLPFTLSTYLGAEEIEAILLHELAHIKRNDYLVNLLQQVISALLFFNPCAQLINKIINEERENCCDDLVVQSAPDPVVYAKALLKLEQTRGNNMRTAMAATGKKYQLLSRIERIMKTKNQPQSLRPALLAMLILTVGIGFITLLNPQIAEGKISLKGISPAIAGLFSDTTRKSTTKKALLAKKEAERKEEERMEILADMSNGHFMDEHNKKLDDLNAEIQKHSDKINAYYNSGNFKTFQRDIEKSGKMLDEAYNNPDVKKMEEKLAKLSAEYGKNWDDNDKLKDITAKMGKKGAEIGAYYSSDEFIKMNKELMKKYGIPEHHVHFDDRDNNYKLYQEELKSRIPARIKDIDDQLAAMGDQISGRYENPASKKQQDRMQALGDSLNLAFSNPALEDQKLKMEALTRQMSDYQNNPALREEAEQLKKSVEKLTSYINSPEYRRYLKTFKFNHNFNYNFNYNDDYDRPEKPEKPERPERPEKPGSVKPGKPESPEKPENAKPEKPEKPDAPEAPEAPQN